VPVEQLKLWITLPVVHLKFAKGTGLGVHGPVKSRWHWRRMLGRRGDEEGSNWVGESA
jgi:hypothetical protein